LPGISIHAVDIARGVLAAGMQVELYALGAGGARQLIARGLISANAPLDEPALAAVFPPAAMRPSFTLRGSTGRPASRFQAFPFSTR